MQLIIVKLKKPAKIKISFNMLIMQVQVIFLQAIRTRISLLLLFTLEWNKI